MAEWRVGIALLAVLLLACCLPMIKMMMTGKSQECSKTGEDHTPEGEMEKANIQEAKIVQSKTRENG